MGWFAYSLQEVLSYLILSPRCLYDGSKVAYGGREWLSWPPAGAKLAQAGAQLASRSFHMGISFALWTEYSLPEVLSYLILSRSCFYDGSKVAYGGREWLKLDLRRTHDALGRPEDGSR